MKKKTKNIIKRIKTLKIVKKKTDILDETKWY